MPKAVCRSCGRRLREEFEEGAEVHCWLCWPKAKEREINEFLQAERERKEKKR